MNSITEDARRMFGAMNVDQRATMLSLRASIVAQAKGPTGAAPVTAYVAASERAIRITALGLGVRW